MIQAIPILTQGLIPTSSGAAAGEVSDVPQLTAAPSGTDKVVLTLVPPADSDYSTCTIYRAVVGGLFTELTDLVSGTYDDTDVEAEVVYYYIAIPQNADSVGGRPSRVAYARCLSWTAAKFAFTNASPDAVNLESNAGRLLYRTCQVISELELFKQVLPFLRPQPAWQAPACVVAFESDEEQAVTNAGYDVPYRFKLGFVVAGRDNARLALQCLSLRESIKRTFRGSGRRKMLFADVVGHYDTNVVQSAASPMGELEGGALFYNSGLTLEFMVKEMRGLT